MRTAGRSKWWIALPSFENPVDETPSVHATRAVLREALAREVPALGLCLGSQLLAQAGGARAYACTEEYGYAPVELDPAAAGDRLLEGVPATIETFHAHGYAVELAPGAVALARTPSALQAYRLGEVAWGIQFHPEPSVELVDRWIGLHAAYMRTKGLDPDALAAAARRLEPAARELATTIASRFAAVVHERARG